MMKRIEKHFYFVMLCCFIGTCPALTVLGDTETKPEMTASLVPKR